MRLRALRLHGFKSFADRTEVVFHDGITAIVGPNGCGKSNISDAIRWVLGEQRPTAIRGAKMEEVIFQGTVNRRPVNRASVTMDVTNEDGALPVPFEEVEISRTVYRDGGSEYALNRSTCRLRDIQDLCRDTGLGSNAYSIIENRMIDAILSDRAEERRGLFEEAAGIGKYKDRRKSATRRLERAEMDLQRLEDLIGEVESKVRSLARQKGKAERYREHRARRLDLDVALARRQLDGLEARLVQVRTALSGDVESDESLGAAIQAAEARLEKLRVDRLEAERERSRAGSHLEGIRAELARWERDLAVIHERAEQGARRLERIVGERGDEKARAAAASSEDETLAAREAELARELAEVAGKEEDARARSGSARAELAEVRRTLDALEARDREVARRTAQLLGDAESAGAQGEELARRVSHLEEERATAADALGELDTQGDLFADRVTLLEEAAATARQALEGAARRLEETVARLDAARQAELAAEDRAASLETRIAALKEMERGREGADPALKALFESKVSGVVGVLTDFLEADADVAPAVEAVLGAHAGAVVVRDSGAAREVVRWFTEQWGKGGGLVLLPLDRAPDPAGSGDGSEDGLLERVRLRGEGAPWARAFLEGVTFATEDALLEGDGARVAPDGSSVDAAGIVRVGKPLGNAGTLERRERLRSLEGEAKDARAEAEAARAAREALRGEATEAEREVESARAALRDADDAHREAQTEARTRADARTRLDRERSELELRLDATRTAVQRARDRVEVARAEHETLRSEEEALHEERTRARSQVEAAQEGWEQARSEEAALTVERTRLQGEVNRVRDRRGELARQIAAADRRREALDAEEAQLRDERAQGEGKRADGEQAMAELFARREQAEVALRERDEAWSELEERLVVAEREAREVRGREREASERRHRLELEAGEIEGRIGRIGDRLEGEWGRPLERLVADAQRVEGEEQDLREELRGIVEALERLGPVNMLAVEEHEEESTRLEFLKGQQNDLVEARDDLRSAIRDINQTAIRLFQDSFDRIRENFRSTFQRLFQGGECDLWLADPDDPLEAPIEIHASPRGKRTQRIDLLSGGERALTALSLLFGIYLVKPSPFCVLDEVDAPLDESNIGRFIVLLQEFKAQSQFVVITHNPRTIEAADWIYGVTMEEPGVSSIVGVQLEDALPTVAAS